MANAMKAPEVSLIVVQEYPIVDSDLSHLFSFVKYFFMSLCSSPDSIMALILEYNSYSYWNKKISKL